MTLQDLVDELTEAKGVRGKAQKAIMKALQHGEMELNDMARGPDFRGIHLAQIMKAAEALQSGGHVKIDPKTQAIKLA